MSKNKFLKVVKKHPVTTVLLVGLILVFVPDPLDLLSFGSPIADILVTALVAVGVAVFK